MIQENEIRKAKKLEELMVKLNLAVEEDDSSSPKVLTYQRTPTPRHGHWPQSPTAVVPQSKPADSEATPNVDSTSSATKPITGDPSTNKTVTDISSCDPVDGSCDTNSGSHGSPSVAVSSSGDPQHSSSDSGSVTVHKPDKLDTGSADDVESGSQISGSQANS